MGAQQRVVGRDEKGKAIVIPKEKSVCFQEESKVIIVLALSRTVLESPGVPLSLILSCGLPTELERGKMSLPTELERGKMSLIYKPLGVCKRFSCRDFFSLSCSCCVLAFEL